MSQTQHVYYELMQGASDTSLRIADRLIEAGQGELLHGTILALNPATNKYVIWDSDSEAAVLTVANPVAQAPAVTTETVIKTQDPEATAVVVATVAAPVIAAPAVTTATIATTPIVGLAILLEDVDATNEVSAKVGLTGQIANSALVLAGSTITTVTNFVRAVLQLNGIFVTVPTNANVIAGE